MIKESTLSVSTKCYNCDKEAWRHCANLHCENYMCRELECSVPYGFNNDRCCAKRESCGGDSGPGSDSGVS